MKKVIVAPGTASPSSAECSTAWMSTESPAVRLVGATTFSVACEASAVPARAKIAVPITIATSNAATAYFIGFHLLPAPVRLQMRATQPPALGPGFPDLPPPPRQRRWGRL